MSMLPAKSPTVVFKPMDQGGVLFCSRTEFYFGLNIVGAAIWDRLPAAEDAPAGELSELLDTLEDLFPTVDRKILESDVREFLIALEESELVAYAERPEE